MLKIILEKELRGLLRQRRIIVMLIIAGFMFVYLPAKIFSRLAGIPGIMENLMDFYMIIYAPFVFLLMGYSANHILFAQEKTSGILHSLLATPINLHTLWLGKTLSIVILGYGLSILSTGAFILAGLYYFPDPVLLGYEIFIPSLPGLLALFIVNPVLCFSFLGIIGIITLITNDEIKVRLGNFVIIMFAFYVMRPGDMTDLTLVFYYQCVICIALTAIALISTRFLTNERVLLG